MPNPTNIDKLIASYTVNKNTFIYMYAIRNPGSSIHYSLRNSIDTFCGLEIKDAWSKIKYNKLANVLPNTDLFDTECEVCQRALLKLKSALVPK